MPRPLFLALLLPAPVLADPVVLEQVVSRHDPHFDVARSRLAVGRDGNVYLGNGHGHGGYVLRVSPDGTETRGGPVGHSFTAVAVGKDGTIATAEAHFAHRVALWGPDFAPLGHVPEFLVNDQVQWNAPSDVVAGPSGDFYAVDQHRLRVVRVVAPNKQAAVYPLDRTGEQTRGGSVGLRVDEANQRFLTAWPSGMVWATGFDGKPLWSVKAKPAGEPPGAFDLDDGGKLYLLAGGDVVKVFDRDGKPDGEVKLRPDAAGKGKPVTDLRVLGGELIVKRTDPTALFEAYDRTDGKLVRRVPADVEVLTVKYPSAVWTAGKAVQFDLAFDPGSRKTKSNFRVWARPLGVPEFAEWPRQGGKVTPPGGARGLYQVRVTPDARGRTAEYTVDGIVEVRVPDARGSVSILTPLNRFYYGRGEEIPVTVLLRTTKGAKPPASVAVKVKRSGADGTEHTADVGLPDGRGEFTIPAAKTATLALGRYVLDADVPGYTVAPQYLDIGPGLASRPKFHLVQHGDYSHGFPAAKFIDEPEAVADHLNRARALGINLFVDRLGHQSGLGELAAVATDPALAERLKADPLAVAPEKAAFEGTVRRTVAGYGARGIEEQAILLYMDAGLPVGTLFDARKPEQMEKDVRQATRLLLAYPAFRGWSWAANWWLEKHGAAAAKDEAEKKAYEAALKTGKETGAWDPVLDAVSDRTFAHAVEAEKRFRAALNAVAAGKVSAMTGPYRAILTHPPVTFRNADEVDLHYQAEQVQPPLVAGHHVDFYKRPGKPAWGHPELWNDDGTGGMIVPTLAQMLMRGADGVGQSGPVGPWGGRHPDQADPRNGVAGTTSAVRATYELFRRYGAWNATLDNADRVAIVVSTRMQRIETWDGKIGGSYFDTLFEAYNACLYAHRPASFVFAEDLKPDTFKRFQAALVVGQRVELDPPLADALKQAQAGGLKVFHDGTCRPEMVKEYIPLNVTFDRVKQDPSAWQDDAAYYRFPRYFKAHAEELRKVLGPVVKPVAECDNPEVLLTERRAGDMRFVWVVNNTMLDWDLGLAWRVSLLMSHRVPAVEKLKLDVPDGWAVYDMFARREVKAEGGVVTANLRSRPVSLFAVLPPGKMAPVVGSIRPTGALFGPHVRDMAVSPDGRTALLNTFNWDHNLYGVNLDTGETRFRDKLGHGFAFAPTALHDGFAVQGFDVFAGEGYHLYHLSADGTPERRFALFGLPKRATSWASAGQVQDPGLNAFAAAPNGGWVASAGDLGLAVWDRDGKPLWADEWWKETRKRVRLVALDDQTLVVLDGPTAAARNPRTGAVIWSLKLADTGTLRGAVVSGDRRTLVVHANTLGGRLFVIRAGKLVNTVLTAADEVAVSPDGSFLVATEGRLLKAFDPLAGLLWTYTGDDILRHPRVSPTPDKRQVAVGSELGTLTVLDKAGVVVAERDMRALPVPEWVPGGDLVVATWMGRVTRLGADMTPRWDTRLLPTEADARSKLLAKDQTPTTRRAGWGNAAPQPLPLTPNLLAETKATVSAVHDPKTHGDPRPWQNKVELLTDGKPDAPPKPWLEWTDVGMVDSGWRNKLTLEIDTFRTRLRVTGITFVEDPAHPESWLRDMRLQWWDAAAEAWRDGPYLLSDAAVHSHLFDKPIEAARFRLVSTGGGTWPVGNLRLAELVFHGQSLGCSHPDAAAGKAVAVLFDEAEADLNSLKYPGRPFGFRYTGAFAGSKCLELSAAGETGPAWQPPFGHAVPNWDFEVAEDPKPGQYRYLQFAWKAASDKTTGMGLLLGRAWPGGGVAVTVGDAKWKEGVIVEDKVNGKPPAEWKTVRVDLWALTKGKPPRVQALNLMAVGGGALFDRILLGRTPAELDRAK